MAYLQQTFGLVKFKLKVVGEFSEISGVVGGKLMPRDAVGSP